MAVDERTAQLLTATFDYGYETGKADARIMNELPGKLRELLAWCAEKSVPKDDCSTMVTKRVQASKDMQSMSGAKLSVAQHSSPLPVRMAVTAYDLGYVAGYDDEYVVPSVPTEVLE